MSAHTPGPWEVYARTENEAHIGSVSDEFGHIATLTEWPHEQREADARLIAAAPDLVTELRRCIVMLRSLAGDIEDGIAPQLRHKVIAAIDNCTEPARAVLARAGV